MRPHKHTGNFCQACADEERYYSGFVKALNASADRILRGEVVDFDVPREKKVPEKSFLYKATYQTMVGPYDQYVVATTMVEAMNKLDERLREHDRQPYAIEKIGEVYL